MYYDYRQTENSLFEIEFPKDLNDDSRKTLLESVIGADIENGHVKILLSTIVEHPELVSYSFVVSDGNGRLVRREANFVPYSKMRDSLVGKHEGQIVVTEFDRCGNITKKTAYTNPSITELSNNDDGVMLDVQYCDVEEIDC